MSTLTGSPDADVLMGLSDDDVLIGLGGDDTISGGAGDDTATGGDGADLIEGEDGNDVLVGEAGADTLLGGSGQDLIAGGAGDDSIDGGAGRDILVLESLFANYTITELTAHTATTPGTYRIVDTRAGSPEGTDTITGIEVLRFGAGGEMTLADALRRAPTDILVTRTAASGPQVLENAVEGTFVARLEAVDPDPGDTFTYAIATVNGSPADAGGRFRVEGANLMVARNGVFDFDTATSHSVTVQATDHFGNTVLKTLTVTVRDSVDVFSALSVTLPAGASEVRLWDLDAGGYVVTWQVTEGQTVRIFSRVVDDAGNGLPAPGQPEGSPPAPDRVLAESTSSPRPRLLGVDDEGVAALVTENANSVFSSSLDNEGPNTSSSYSESHDDLLRWVDTASGSVVKTTSFGNSSQGASSSAGSYPFDSSSGSESSSVHDTFMFDDGLVIFRQATSASSNFFGNSGYGASSSASDYTRREAYSTISDGSGARLLITGSDVSSSSSTTSFTGSSDSSSGFRSAPFIFDMTEGGVSFIVNQTIISSGGAAEPATSLTAYAGNNQVSLSAPSSAHDFADAAIHDSDTYALVFTRNDGPQPQQVAVEFRDGSRKVLTEINLSSGSTLFGAEISAFGSDRYLVFVREYNPIAGEVRLNTKVFDAQGNPLTGIASYSNGTLFTGRDNGTVVAYATRTALDGSVVLEGQVALAESIIATPLSGAFSDIDGDGDLDHSGVLFIGHRQGETELLRLEGGAYELTTSTLKVTSATVYAAIGDNIGTPLFSGSFTVNRATGVVSNLVTTIDEDSFRPGGLVPSYSAITFRPDAAVLTATFGLPDFFFGSGPRLELSSPNALLINAGGPMISGYEVKLPPGKLGATLGDPAGIIAFNLFEAKSKGLTVKYDAIQDEWGISGELTVTSDIVEALAALGGASNVAFTFKDLKIKDGKYDFQGEFSAKEWEVGSFKLKDVKLGVTIDDDVVVAVDVAAGFGLPFKQLTGLSFAGQLLRPPLTLNKLAVTAETAIPLPYGLFLDSISASLTNMAGSPPEPIPLPTTLTGTLGIGWGPKVPEITLPEFLGIDPIKEARIVNATLAVATDFTSSVSATGTINLYNDAVAKHTGAITWDWQKGALTLVGQLDYFSGLVTGNVSLKLSSLGLTQTGTVAIAIPNAPIFSFLAGNRLAGASTFTQILLDGDTTNDFLAAWGQISIPVVGNITAGIKFNFNTGLFSLITGANDLPKTNSFDVGGTEPWLMIAAAWENDASGEVLTRVRTPEGTFIAEADYAANGITIIAEFTGPRTKTIVIETPRAGNWDLQVIDPTGLGTVSYKGFTPNPPVGIEITAASAGVGEAEGEITATLTGADPGTKVTFWADDDMAGLDGFALASATVDADGAVSVTFPTTLLSGGTWFVYAIADDGMGAPAHHYFASPITVAHRPEGLVVEAWTPPLDPAAQARVEQTALPGTVVADLSVETPDLAESHVFTLLDDAGGRFVIDGARLVVGTGAPLDALYGSYVLSVRITSGAGLSLDVDLAVEVDAGDPGHVVRAGAAGIPEVLLGSARADAFHALEAGETVSGGDGADGLWLAGSRADYAIVFDGDGSLAGPVFAFAFAAPDGVDFTPPPNPLDPQPPYLLITDLRDPDAPPVVVSGVEFLQFSDQRVAASSFVDPASLAVYTGTEGNDTVVSGYVGDWTAFGLGGDDDLTGGEGNDTLNGGSGNDSLTGGAGDDSLNGSFGDDTMSGGAGNDTFRVNAPGDVVVEAAGEGEDLVEAAHHYLLGDHVEHLLLLGSADWMGTGNGLANRITGNAGANLLVGFDGNDTLSGMAGDDTLVGGNGNDSLSGGAGTDTLNGGDGNDSLDGGDGDDLLNGNSGNDTMTGGAGNDTFSVNARGDVVIEAAGEGADLVRASVSWRLADHVEHLDLLGSGNFSGTGNGLDNWITGNAGANVLSGGDGRDSLAGMDGNDTLRGNAGDDSLEGGDGADSLIGGQGSDLLVGGEGNDVLSGGVGTDTLTGGSGADTFAFGSLFESRKGALADTITDFEAGVDRIDLSAIGGLAYAGTAAFAASGSGEVRHFLDSLGNTRVQVDADGNGTSDMEILLLGTPALSAADFVL